MSGNQILLCVFIRYFLADGCLTATIHSRLNFQKMRPCDNIVRVGKDVYDALMARETYTIYAVSGCGSDRIITDLEGTVQSDGYPDGMGTDDTCNILFQPGDNRITEIFFEDFHVGECDTETFVEVGDFYGSFSPSLCGVYDQPDNLLGYYERRELKIVHVIGNNTSGFRGFSVKFRTLDEPSCPHTMEVLGMSGTVQSAYYPRFYPNLLRCRRVIMVPQKKHILLTFIDFDFGDECGDGLIIFGFDLRYGSGPSNRYCGTNLPPVSLEFSSNAVTFLSDVGPTVGYRGYSVDFKIFTPVYDFVKYKEAVIDGNAVRAWFTLLSLYNKPVVPISDSCFEWNFHASARHADICDMEYEDVVGFADDKTGVVYFEYGLARGRYIIDFHAESIPKKYKFSHSYEFTITNKGVMRASCDLSLKLYVVEFSIHQHYKYFTKTELGSLRRSLTAEIQVLYDDVFVEAVLFSQGDNGYLMVHVELKGKHMMTRLRKICSYVTDNQFFKLCSGNKVMELGHDRKVTFLGREFGHGTINPCDKAMFVAGAECVCPCNCAGDYSVKLK